MARDLDGLDDVITATVTAIDSGDLTLATWANPDTLGESSTGRLISLASGANQRQWLYLSATASFAMNVDHATVDAVSLAANSSMALDVWGCFVATLRTSDSKIRLFYGDLDTPMAEVSSYTTQTAGTGARSTGGTAVTLGNNPAGDRAHNGALWRPFIDAREWTLAEMEEFRLGTQPVQTGSLRGYWPLDSPTASQAEDLSGNGANGTVTGAIVVDDPPVPGAASGAIPVLVVSAAVVHQATASGSSSTTGAAAALLGLAGTAAGTSTTTGSAAAELVHPASASGTSSTTGSAAALLALLATASGTSTSDGSAAALLAVQATASGASSTTGAAAAEYVHPATASGTSSTTGVAAGLLGLAATASGSSSTTGSAVGGIGFPATASGSSSTDGSAAATLTFPATASGSSSTTGAAAALLALQASATGTSTTSGDAAALLGLAGVAGGASTTTGSASALSGLVVSAAGTSTTAGSAAGLAALQASAAGTSTTSGSASATVVVPVFPAVIELQASYAPIVVLTASTEAGMSEIGTATGYNQAGVSYNEPIPYNGIRYTPTVVEVRSSNAPTSVLTATYEPVVALEASYAPSESVMAEV